MLKEKIIRSNYCGYRAVKLERDKECKVNTRDPYMSRNEHFSWLINKLQVN